jgi:hypothetical protein
MWWRTWNRKVVEKYLSEGKSKEGLQGENLSGLNLHGLNFYGQDLEGTDFRKANLLGANFVEVSLVSANLYKANLASVNLKYCDLNKADLRLANLKGAYLWRTNLRGALGVVYREYIGSRNDTLYAFFADAEREVILFKTGCVCLGERSFKSKVRGTHDHGLYAQQYFETIKVLKKELIEKYG